MASVAAAQENANFEFFATCAKGFESLLAGELASLEIKSVRALQGQVAFMGSVADAYRVCLWSRIASRVILVFGHCDAGDADALYAGIKEFAWEEHLPLDATFLVDAHGTNDNLRNSQFVALRAKDAICDRMQAKLGGRPNIDTKNPNLRVVVRLRGDRATIGLDLSGAPLFRRGSGVHNESDGLGGMRPDYAAALLAAGGWYRKVRKGSPVLASIYSGSGTLVVEAVATALDQAPALHRMHWGFERWLGHDETSWKKLLRNAEKRAEKGAELAENVKVIAVDMRKGAGTAVRQALRASGLKVEPVVLTKVADFAEALAGVDTGTSAPTAADGGNAADESNLLATVDLSWLGASAQAQEISALGFAAAALAQLPTGVQAAAITASTALDQMLNLEPSQTFDVMLGRDQATMRLYTTDTTATAAHPTITLKDGAVIPVLEPASDQFAARLTKVAKQRRKWAAKEDISCYRVYDADLPDYVAAIDLYQASEFARKADAGKRWLVIQEYAAPKQIDPELAHRRLLDILAIAPHVLGVDPANVSLRVRQHGKGGSQYADGGAAGTAQGSNERGRDGRNQRNNNDRSNKRSRKPRFAPGSHLIDEGGLSFEVNFENYLDTGIFLDHRDVRAEVREMAKQTQGSKRFLNLFAYTGTATCYAIDGGAKHTTTVDLSQTYLDWAQRNLAHNDFEAPEHEFVRADVVRWVSQQRRTPNRWDLIFCDPPTFSNSKRMGRDSFDVQRDHAELLIGISRLLTKNGVCLFSCNLRGFKPDVEKLQRAGVQIEDVTEGTIPEDFSRNAKIHHCYLVRRTPREDTNA